MTLSTSKKYIISLVFNQGRESSAIQTNIYVQVVKFKLIINVFLIE